jgi:protein TIF31
MKLFVCCVNAVDPSELSEAVRALGFPKMHRHRLACLRQELIDAFVE